MHLVARPVELVARLLHLVPRVEHVALGLDHNVALHGDLTKLPVVGRRRLGRAGLDIFIVVVSSA